VIATTRDGKVEVLVSKQDILDFALGIDRFTGLDFPVGDLVVLFSCRGRLLKIDGFADDYGATEVITLARRAQNFARENGLFF